MKINQIPLILLLMFSIFGCKDNNPVQEISVLEFKQMSQKQNTVVLDVRTQKEVELGKIENALHADVLASDFKEKIEKLDSTKHYLVYCKAGVRSKKACKIMQNQGLKASSLTGGYTAYSKAN